MRRIAPTLAILVTVAACGGTAATTATTDVPDTSVPPTTAPPSTAAPSTTTGPGTTTTAPPATTTSTTSTTQACPPFGDTAEVRVRFPEFLSPLIGKDIRTGAEECLERVVIELQTSSIPTPAGFPGYHVRYADGPVKESPSDLPVTISGSDTLLVSLGSWMNYQGTAGYSGPSQIFPANVDHIQELRLIENFEGTTTWAIGLDDELPFRVIELSNPPRLLIEFSTNG
jgi:hypothetical protein